MSILQNDLETHLAAPINGAPRLTQVLIVASTPRIGDALHAEMTADAEVEGQLVRGTLAETVLRGEIDWNTIDFVVFEASTPHSADIDSVQRLISRTGGALSCIAVTGAAIDAKLSKELTDAGVAEIMILPAPARTELNDAPENLFADDSMDDDHAPAPPLRSQVTPAIVTATQSDATAKRAAPRRGRTGRLSAIMRARGGAGATTIAVNLAVAQAALTSPGSVALVDLDIQNGAVALAMDLPDSAQASAWTRGETHPSRGFLDAAMVRHGSGVDVLCAPDIFAPLDALDPVGVAALLEALKARYDHIILDLPQAVTEWTLPVLASAEQVVVVTDTSLPAIKRTRRLIDLIGEEHMTLPVHVVVNNQKKPFVASTMTKECETLIGRPLKHWIPPDPKTARRATDLGVPLLLGAKRSRMARAIAALRTAILPTSAAARA